MAKKSKKQKKHINFTSAGLFLLVFIVLLLSIGYSASTTRLTMSQMKAYIRADANIRLTGLRIPTTTNGGSASNTEFSIKNIYGDMDLPNANSTITYEVSVTNFGNVEMGIMDIIGLPSNLEYTLDGYVLEGTLCDSNNGLMCTTNSVTTFLLTISYAESGYNSSNTNYPLNLEFDFQETHYTAKMNDHYYATIQAAIDAAPTDHTETTITLLKNTYERIKVWSGNNIVFDMPGLVLHNKEFVSGGTNAGDPVVEIFGTKNKSGGNVSGGYASFKMINGSIVSEANQAGINCEAGSTFYMEGGSITMTGDSNRQALYIKDGASAVISGDSYLKAHAVVEKENYRATVQVVNGSLTILGGTIESDGGGGIALTNESTVTIGTKDGNIDTSTPTIIGQSIGMHIKQDSTVNFYDGTIKGKTISIRNESDIDDIETGYDVAHSGETIYGEYYTTAFLGHGVLITFDPDGGSVEEASRIVALGAPIGALPVPEWLNHDFLGWYTQGGVLVQPTDIVGGANTYYAHWEVAAVARIGTTTYPSITNAISAATNNTPTTISLVRDTAEKVTIGSNKNIIFDFQGYTLSNSANNAIVITNNGTLTLVSGTISTNATAAAISNNKNLTITGGEIRSTSANTSAINNLANATLEMSGGSIIATGLRQAIYDSGGTVRISGDAYLSSAAKVESGKNRGTVQNEAASSKIYITGGTIISTATNGIGISNLGTLTIGVEDGDISTTSPVIRGPGKAIHNTNILNFYDGILQSPGTPLSGSVTATDSAGTPTTGSMTIDNTTYNTWYLASTS